MFVSFPRGSVGDSLTPVLRMAAQPSLPLPAGISAVSAEVQLDSGGPAFTIASHSRAPILEIDIPAAAGDLHTQKGFVLLTRTPSGAPGLHGQARASDRWVTHLAEIDPDSRKLRFPLPTLPKSSHYLVARLSAGQLRQARAAAPLRAAKVFAATVEDAAARAPAAAELEPPVEAPIATSLDLPWAVICDTSDPTLTRATCESEAYRAKASMLAKMARTTSTITLRSPEMGYQHARLSTATFETLEHNNLPYILSRAQTGPQDLFITILVRRDVSAICGNGMACWPFSTHQITVDWDSLESADQALLTGIFAHELFHAIQGNLIPRQMEWIYSAERIGNPELSGTWFSEGSANAFGFAHRTSSAAELAATHVTPGVPRDFRTPLTDIPSAYGTYEALVRFDPESPKGSIRWLHRALKTMRTLEAGEMRGVLNEALNKGRVFPTASRYHLGEALANAMQEFTPQTGYPHCAATVTLPAGQTEMRVVPGAEIAPLTHHCLNVQLAEPLQENECLTAELVDSPGSVILMSRGQRAPLGRTLSTSLPSLPLQWIQADHELPVTQKVSVAARVRRIQDCKPIPEPPLDPSEFLAPPGCMPSAISCSGGNCRFDIASACWGTQFTCNSSGCFKDGGSQAVNLSGCPGLRDFMIRKSSVEEKIWDATNHRWIDRVFNYGTQPFGLGEGVCDPEYRYRACRMISICGK